MWTSIVSSALLFGTQVLKHLGQEKQIEYAKKLIDLKSRLHDATSLPLDKQNDKEIEDLYFEIKNIFDLASAQLKNYENS